MPRGLLRGVQLGKGGVETSKERKESRKKERREEEISTWTPLEIASGAVKSGSSGSCSHAHTHTQSSSLCFPPSEVRHKTTQWCYSVVHLILNLLSSLSTLSGLWPLLQLAK